MVRILGAFTPPPRIDEPVVKIPLQNYHFQTFLSTIFTLEDLIELRVRWNNNAPSSADDREREREGDSEACPHVRRRLREEPADVEAVALASEHVVATCMKIILGTKRNQTSMKTLLFQTSKQQIIEKYAPVPTKTPVATASSAPVSFRIAPAAILEGWNSDERRDRIDEEKRDANTQRLRGGSI